MIKARLSIAALLVGTMVLAGGCDLFSTRDAEPPDSGRRTWETPRVPGDVLDNLQSALLERDAVNYLRSFSPDSFRFMADQVALARDPALAEWGYAEESQHITRLLSGGALPGDSILAVVFTSPVETLLGDSAEIRTEYELSAGVALAGVPRRMAGTAEFVLRMGREGYWQIYGWRDNRTEERNTWSDFKSLVR